MTVPGALRRALPIVTLAALAGALVLFRVQLCPLALVFHVPCPACGLTRASMALLHGDLALALRLHPLAPVVAPCLAIYLGGRAGWEIARGTPPPHRWEQAAQRLFAVLAVLGLIVWAARFLGQLGGPVPV